MEAIPLRRSVYPGLLKLLLTNTLIAFSMFFMSAAYATQVGFLGHLIFTDNPGWWSQQAYAADINGDGHLDAISCSRFSSGPVHWFENSGGSPPTFTTHLIDHHPDCRAVFAADIDGDGDTDLLSASALIGAREVRWYENDGAATPGFTLRVVPTTAIDFFAVWADDLDGDGDTDLITGSGPTGPSSNQVAWHENLGGMPPVFVERELSRNTNWPHSIRTADLDGDRDLDIAVGSLGDGKVVWYENDGSVVQPSFIQQAVGNEVSVPGIDVADVNGDGHIDVLAADSDPANSAGAAIWFENNRAEDPVFNRRVIDAGTPTSSLSAADVDGDGDLDVFSAERPPSGGTDFGGEFAWYENAGGSAPGFIRHLIAAGPDPVPPPDVGAQIVLAGDFDNDLNTDVLAQESGWQYPQRLIWYENLLEDFEILFEDHFDSPVLSPEWISIKPSHWVEDGWLYSQDTGPGRDAYAMVHEGDRSWADYTYAVLAEGVPSMGGDVDTVYILFRMSDISWGPFNLFGRYYQLAYYQPSGNLTLRRNRSLDSVDGDLDRDFLFIGEGIVPKTGPAKFRITVSGPRIEVSIDGLKVIDVVDPEPLLYGGIGIGSLWEAVAKYDDVVVTVRPEERQPLVQCTGDVNGDGVADIAVVTADGDARVKGLDGDLISQFAFSDIKTVVDVETMPNINANGSPELVALGTGSVQAEVRDTLTAAQLSLVGFNPAYTPLDLELVDDQTGNSIPELANLAQGSVKVEVRDGLNGNPVNSLSFSSGFDPVDLEVYPDLNTNGSPELAVLGNSENNNKSDRIQVRDLATGKTVQNIWLGQGWQVLNQELVTDFNGNGADEVAVLRVRPSDNAVNVLLRDTMTGKGLGSIGFDRNYPPTQLLTIADINGNGADEVVVFGQRFNGGNQKAQIKDSKTKAKIGRVFFDRNFAGQDMDTCADINGNGSEELVLLGKRASDGKLRAIVKDAGTGELIGVVNF